MILAESLVTAPTSEPVDKADVKASARMEVDDLAFDAQINLLIKQAREAAEHECERCLIAQTWQLDLDGFPAGRIDLPKSPVGSIGSIEYWGGSAWVVLDPAKYTLVQQRNRMAAVYPAAGQSWPQPAETPGAAVRIKYAVGYGTASDVPASVRAWIIANCVFWLENPAAASDRVFNPAPFLAGLLDPIRAWA